MADIFFESALRLDTDRQSRDEFYARIRWSQPRRL